MNFLSFGDSAERHSLTQLGVQLRQNITRASQELATGTVADVGSATKGALAPLAAAERALALTDSYAASLATGAQKAEITQVALDSLAASVDAFAPQVLGMASSGAHRDLLLSITDAGERFQQAVATINSRNAGLSLFSADAPDTNPLIEADDILQTLRGLAGGAATATDMITIVEDWFLADGGGYETDAWQGGTGDPAPVLASDGHAIDASVTALDPAIRQTLAGLALATLVSEQVGPPGEAADREVVTAAAERMQSANAALIIRRAQLGAAESRIEQAEVQSAATRAALEIEVARITGADPYATATALEDMQTRLEAIYLVTARLSRLSLSEYLR